MKCAFVPLRIVELMSVCGNGHSQTYVTVIMTVEFENLSIVISEDETRTSTSCCE